jgi:predicted phosphodiesterase
MSETKILFAGDLHKRSKDITTIAGYVQCNVAVQNALIQLIQQMQYDYFISLGDWYDKGYASDVSASLADYDLDIDMMNTLHGNFYGLIGNHIRLSMDSNPELHLIQPHPVFKSRRPINRANQIMKTPDTLFINGVQISFMHYNIDAVDALDYKPKRREDAKYHIALFHTDMVIPASKLIETNYGYMASPNNIIAEVMDGVDLAICGHIHNPLGKFTITTKSGRTMMMVVPGSLTNVDAGENSRHTSIALPSVTIGENGEVKLEFIPFDLKTNLVTFSMKNLEEKRNKIKSLRGKSIEQIHDGTVTIVDSNDEVLLSLNRYMQVKGYSAKDKNLVRSILNAPSDLVNLINTYIE